MTDPQSSLGPYRSAPEVGSPGRVVPRSLSAIAALSVALGAVLGGVAYLRPEPRLADTALPNLASDVRAFPLGEEAWRVATPLAPLLAGVEPEQPTMFGPAEGVSRVRRGSVLSVRFDRPMVRPTQVGRAATELPIEVDPPIEASAVWASRSRLDIMPVASVFDRNLEVAVRVRVGARALDGAEITLDDLERRVVFDGHPRIVDHSSQVAVGAPIELLFDSPIPTANVARGMLAYEAGGGGRALPVRVVGAGVDDEGRHRVAVWPLREVLPGQGLGLAFAPPFAPWEASSPFEVGVSVEPRPHIDGVGCTLSSYGTLGCAFDEVPGDVVDIEAELLVRTTHPIVAPSVEAVRVTPPVEGLAVAVSGEGREALRHLRVSAEWAPDQVYEVRLPSLVTTRGERVVGVGPLAVRSQGHPAQLEVALTSPVFELDDTRGVAFRGIHLDRSVFHVASLRAGDEEGFLRALTPRSALGGTPTPLGPLAPTSRANRWGHGRVPLEPSVQAVAFVADPTCPETRRVVLAQRTDLAITGLLRDDGVLAWVTRLGSAQPVVGAEVVAVANGVLARATTSTNGVAFLEIPPDAERPSAIAVSFGDEQAWLPWERVLSPPPPEDARHRVAYVVVDRGIHRPGETVRMFATLRDTRARRAPRAGEPIELRVWDPVSSVPFALLHGNVDDHGIVSAALTLPEVVPLGEWRVEAVSPEAQTVVLGTASTVVREYREPRLRVDLSRAGDEPLRGGDTLRSQADLRYLFGSAVREGTLHMRLARTGPAALPSSLRDVVTGPLGAWVRPQVLAERDVEVVEGRAELSGTLEFASPIRSTFELSASYSDDSGEEVTGVLEVMATPSAFELGLEVMDAWSPAGEPLRPRVVAFAPDGTLEARDVEIRFEREGWHGWWEWNDGVDDAADGAVLRRTRRGELVHRCRVRTSVDPAARAGCDFIPPRSGTMRITVTAVGGSLAEQRVYVAGPDEHPDRDPPGAPIEVTVEQRELAPGDTARLVFENPWPAARALVVGLASGMTLAELHEVGAGSQVIEVPVDASMAPNAHVGVVLVRPRTGAARGRLDLDAPDVRFGAAEVRVVPPSESLVVRVEVPPGRRSAGETTDVEVTVVDGSGHPVRDAAVVAWAVDEGTLRQTSYAVSDPVRAFFPDRLARFAFDDLRRHLVSRVVGDSEAPISGDGGYAEDVRAVPSRERFEPTIAWRTDLRTDARGRVLFPVALPARSSSYRVFAVALDDAMSSGIGEAELSAVQDLVVRTSLPSFVTEGDALTVRVLIQNPGEVSTTVRPTVRVLADGVPVPTQVPSEIVIDGGAEAAFDLAAGIPAGRQLDVHISAGEARLERSIPIVPLATFERQSVLVSCDGDCEIPVSIPDEVRVGRVTVRAASHPFVDAERLLDDAIAQGEPVTIVEVAAAIGGLLAADAPRLEVEAREAAVSRAVEGILAMQDASGAFCRVAGCLRGWEGTTTVEATSALQALLGGARPWGTDVLRGRVHDRALPAALDAVVAAIDSGIFANPEDQASALRVLAIAGRPRDAQLRAAFERRQFAFAIELANLALASRAGSREHLGFAAAACGELERESERGALAAIVLAATPTHPDCVRRGLERMLAAPGVRFGREAVWAARAEARVAAALPTSGVRPRLELGGITSNRAGEGALRVDAADLAGRGARIRVAHTGRSYVTIVGEWARPLTEEDQEARSRADVALHRVFEDESGRVLEANASVPLGSLVRVRLFLHRERTAGVRVHDPRPAGVEPSAASRGEQPLASLARMLGLHPSDETTDARAELASRSVSQIARVEHGIQSTTFELAPFEVTPLTELTYVVRASSLGRFGVPPAELIAESGTVLARSAAHTLEVVAR